MILTLVITKDYIDPENMRMLQEQNITQDIYIVSAVPVDAVDNIVVDVDQSLPLGVRMGISINKALGCFDLNRYSHILKIDGDVSLCPGVIQRLLSLDEPICGTGNCLLVKVPFFIEVHKERWGECQGEDQYMILLPFALGLIDWYQFKPIEGINYPYVPHSDREMRANGETERAFGLPFIYALHYTVLCRNINYLLGWLSSSYKKAWFADLLRRRVIVKYVLG
jgi:hypothetical protein